MDPSLRVRKAFGRLLGLTGQKIASEAGTPLVLPDGTRTTSLRKGSIEMTSQVGEKTRHLTVHDVEFVPGFKRNLLSLVVLKKRGSATPTSVTSVI
jgi:hypothetical protein